MADLQPSPAVRPLLGTGTVIGAHGNRRLGDRRGGKRHHVVTASEVSFHTLPDSLERLREPFVDLRGHFLLDVRVLQ